MGRAMGVPVARVKLTNFILCSIPAGLCSRSCSPAEGQESSHWRKKNEGTGICRPPPGSNRPYYFRQSEVNRETQLDDPGRKGDRTDGAKGRLVADVGIRVAPDMAVEQIEEIGP